MRQLLLLILLSSRAFSQSLPDPGKVIADKNFDCKNYRFIPSEYGSLSFIDSLYGVRNICDSKNSIEIRFITSYAPTFLFDIVILSYGNNKWSGKKFRFNTDTIYFDSALNAINGKVRVSHIESPSLIDSIFNVLSKNNLFSLPNLSEIRDKPKGPVCGIIHTLTFKAGDNYRTYRFSNTEYYASHSKKAIFRNYNNIFKIFSEQLAME